MRFARPLLPAALLACGLVAFARPAAAQVKYDLRGSVESDTRFTLPGKADTGDHPRVYRNETTGRFRAEITAGRHVRAVGDVELVLTGKREGRTMEGLTQRSLMDPFRLESDALFVQFKDILPGLDLSLGRMSLTWGTADQFNPTRVLNADDAEDPMAFGEPIANQMLVLDWYPDVSVETDSGFSVLDELHLQVAYVPVFRGALLPSSALTVFDNSKLFARNLYVPPDRCIGVPTCRSGGPNSTCTYQDLLALQWAFERQGGTVAFDIDPSPPPLALENGQVGTRFSLTLAGIDLSVSYYRGFDDFPRPETIWAGDIVKDNLVASSSQVQAIILDNDFSGVTVRNKVRLTYPAIQVFGFDAAASLDFLGGMGVWIEGALVFHDDLGLQIRTSAAGSQSPAGVIMLPVDEMVACNHFRKDYFLKVTAGLDYTIFPWWYVSAQYVRGMLDEFGADNLGHYAVLGNDFKLANDRVLIRLFTVFGWSPLHDLRFELLPDRTIGIARLNTGRWSAMLFPQIVVTPWPAAEFSVSGLIYLGASDGKFGAPTSGPSQLVVRGKVSF